MLRPQRTKSVRKNVALSDVFEALVEAEQPMKRSIGFGVFDPSDPSGTVVDRLLAMLPKTAVPLEPTAPRALTPASESAESHHPDGQSP